MALEVGHIDSLKTFLNSLLKQKRPLSMRCEL